MGIKSNEPPTILITLNDLDATGLCETLIAFRNGRPVSGQDEKDFCSAMVKLIEETMAARPIS